MKKVEIYTDGACSGNPGPGGYAAVLVYNEKEKEISGAEKDTTNNRMELMGAIAGLEALTGSCDVTLYTDSKYVSDAFNKGWIDSWRKKNWRKADKKPVLNKDLWERLLLAINTHTVKFIYVEGHAGHKYNERCDELAVQARLDIEQGIKEQDEECDSLGDLTEDEKDLIRKAIIVTIVSHQENDETFLSPGQLVDLTEDLNNRYIRQAEENALPFFEFVKQELSEG